MRHYDEITRFERDGFETVVDKTYEDLHPGDCFDDSCCDIKELCQDIDSGRLDWFMLRVRALIKGREMGCTYLGGCLYEDPAEVVVDGTVESLLYEVLPQARMEAEVMHNLLSKLLDKRVAEAV